MRRTVLVLMAALGLAMSGCGGDDEERLTQEEFVEQGNSICEKSADEIEKVGEEQFADVEEPTEEQITEFVTDTAIPAFNDQLDDLDDLNPPEDTEDTFNDALAEARRAVDELEDNPSAIFAEDDSTFDETNRLFNEAGLTVCGEE